MAETDVNRLLEASRSAHAEYRRAANPESGQPNYPLAEQHVARALELRKQAHELDPNHRSSGWASDQAPHERLIKFYESYTSIP
jgi:hypothetical protein